MNSDSFNVRAFLLGFGLDHKHRTLYDILAFDDTEWDACHDFVQWLFPLHEKSRMAKFSPVITEHDSKYFKQDTESKVNILLALARFREFLGLEPRDLNKIAYWCKNRDHNLLRITRVIRSLRFFGLEKQAKTFHDEVVEIAKVNSIHVMTLEYWRRALEEPLFNSLY